MKTIIIKFFAVMLAAVMCASLAACSQSEAENDIVDNSGSASNIPLINGPEEEDDGAEGSGAEGSADNADNQATEGDEADASKEDVTTTEETPAESTLPKKDAESENDHENAEKDSETETAVITTEAQQTAPSDKGDAVAQAAESAVGYDYLYGGESPEEGGFDNSGLIYYAFMKNGISCPRTALEIMKIGTEVGYDELSRGDAVFFKMDDGSDIVFGGVYVGDGKAVMSFSEGIPVKLVDVTTNYYRSTFVCGIRAVS